MFIPLSLLFLVVQVVWAVFGSVMVSPVSRFMLISQHAGMTFVSTPKELNSRRYCNRSRIAVGSWLASNEASRVILFVKRQDFCQIVGLPDDLDRSFGKGRVLYTGPTKANEFQIPYINSWFQDGARLSQTSYVSMINTDIMLSSDWYQVIVEILDSVGADFKPLIFSTRLNLRFPATNFDRLRFTPDHLLADIDEVMGAMDSDKYARGGIDIFTFYAKQPPVDLSLIPPFLMGRFFWDLGFVGWANQVCNTISTKFSPPIYHIKHKWRRVNRSESDVGYNFELVKANGGYELRADQSKWRLVNGKLVKNRWFPAK
jgi:hypothetical protein